MKPLAIAVCSAACRFPGAPDPESLWRLVIERRSAVREIPPGRWPVDPPSARAEGLGVPDRAASLRGGFLDPVELDEALAIPGVEDPAELDEVHRLALQVGAEAFRAARMERVDRSRVGVVLANIALPTDRLSDATRALLGGAFARRAAGVGAAFVPEGKRLHPLERHALGLPASLLASALGLGGGAATLDAACASSLYAIHLACLELEAGRADAMLVGGVCRPQSIYTQIGFSQLRALSPSGRCAPFDRGADGLVVGEGAGVFLLKRLEDAEAHGDAILGVIRAVGLSNDVAGSLLSPESEGQLRAMRAAWARAGWSTSAIDFVECHGTGTPRGDAVEIASLRALLGEASPAIGSVKANVGHALTAAGAAALCKVLLALRERTLPPATNVDAPIDTGALRLLDAPAPWEPPADRPRRAAVSAFGFGGINAHLLVEEHRRRAPFSAAVPVSPKEQAAPIAVLATAAGEPAVPIVTTAVQASEPAAPNEVAVAAAGGAAAKVGAVATVARKTPAPVVAAFHAKSADAPHAASIGGDEAAARCPVAIVGIGAHFGRLRGKRAFSEALLRGEPILDERPRDRWFGVEGEAPRGAWLTEIEIPIGRYRIPPSEIPSLLPQQLLALETAREAAEDAGDLGARPRLRTGAVIGLGLDFDTADFHLRWTLRQSAGAWAERHGLSPGDPAIDAWTDALLPQLGAALDAPAVLGALGGVLPGRIARELGLGGPCFAISGAEGSGLRALEAAVRLLQAGEVDAMIVGAVDLAGDVRAVRAAAALRPFSRAGRTRPFDAAGDGPTVGEGAVALVLKRLEDALRDGDRIYATIRGLGSAAGGAGACDRALANAWEEAGIDPRRASLIAAHGSGDPREDRLEAEALHRFFPGGEKRCALTSARAVIGDTGAASGLASVAAAALALFSEILPPLAGIESPREGIDWEAGPFHLPRAPQPWLRDRADGPRVAAVVSLGLDGTAQHVVLEGIDRPADAHRAERARPLGERSAAIFVVQGESEAVFSRRIEELRARLDRGGSLETIAAAFWRAHGYRPGLPTRAFVASDREELRRALDGASAPAAPLGGELAFVYPGSGNHYLGMGVGLGLAFPEAIRALDATTDRLRTQSMPDWFAPWLCDWTQKAQRRAARRLAAAPARMMLGQVAHGIAATAVLRSLGLRPHAAIGYSLGESAALFSIGAWTDRDGMFARTMSTPLFTEELAGRLEAARRAYGDPDWHVAVVNRPAARVREALRGTAALLIVNAPGECVIGGRRADVEATVEALGCEALALEGVPTVHCALARDAAEAYRALHVQPTRIPEGVRIYSCGWAEPYEPSPERCADSILHNALHGFDFTEVIERAWRDGVRIFVEAGPQGSCTRMIGRILAGRPHLAVSACQRGVDPARSVLQAIARVAEAGVPVDLDAIYGETGGIEVEAPPPRPVVRVPVGRPAAPLPPPPWAAGEEEAVVQDRPDPHAAGVARTIGRSIAAPMPAPEGAAAVSSEGAARAATIPSTRGHATLVLDCAPRAAAAQAPGMASGANAPAIPHAAPAVRADQGPAPQTAAALVPGLAAAAHADATPKDRAATDGTHVPTATSVSAHAFAASANADAFPPASATAQAVLVPALRTAAAHARFLAHSARAFELQRAALAQRMALLERLLGASPPEATHALLDLPPASGTARPTTLSTATTAPIHAESAARAAIARADGITPRPSLPADATIAFDRAQCVEFAVGSIGRMLGPAWAAIDAHPTRVRLPDEPLMLVDRIVRVEGEPHSLGSGRVVTEHDVLPGAWYLDGGRAPVCISVEAGQADLFLSAWLGIDRQTKGERLYRLLDAQVVFHRDLPQPGETVRYDIRVDRFIRQGDTWLMFFEFDGTIAGEPLITMRGGCAGFFSPQQLASGRGIVGELPCEPAPVRPGARPFRPLLPVERERYDDDRIAALRRGDLTAAFGPAFAGIELAAPLRLPGGRMALVDRILELDPEGGRYGLGRITGEADIHPDDWFLTCHFVDDPVMPGTLMYECCLHTLRIFLLRQGWVFDAADAPADLHVAPVIGATSKLRCRGQVTPATKKVRYRIDVKAMGYDPEPFVLADASMFVDDLHAIEMEGMSLRYAGADGAAIERFWAARALPTYDRAHVLEFASGSPSRAFGDRYARFDAGKRMARLPRPPFSFLYAIRPTSGRPWILEAGASAEARFEVRPDDWYFAAGRTGEMPHAILLEVALQPCGWLAAWSGAALRSEDELFFRNLEGEAIRHRAVRPDEGTLVTRCTLESVSEAGGMILLAYRFAVRSDRGPIFEGGTRFGFFPEAALARQAGLGIDAAALARPAAAPAPIERTAPFTPEEAGYTGDPAQPPVAAVASTRDRFPAGALQMIDAAAVQLDGGPAGLGVAQGMLAVDPDAWFFRAHFFQDPVMPGSLGVEAFLQLLQRWLHARFPDRKGKWTLDESGAHRWTYRGQVRPSNQQVEVLAHVTAVEEGERPRVRADGWLLCDGEAIYALRGWALRLAPEDD